jgi:hypothetical protein
MITDRMRELAGMNESTFQHVQASKLAAGVAKALGSNWESLLLSDKMGIDGIVRNKKGDMFVLNFDDYGFVNVFKYINHRQNVGVKKKVRADIASVLSAIKSLNA